MNLNNRQQLLGIVAGIALALLLGEWLIRAPLARLWTDRSGQISQFKKSVAQGEQLITREEVLRSRWEHMRTNTLSSEVSIAENQVFRAFERWSQGNKLVINGIKPQWKQNDEYATLECRVDAAGTLPEITRFLYEVEKDPLGLKIEVVELAARDDRGQQLTLALQVSGLQLSESAP